MENIESPGNSEFGFRLLLKAEMWDFPHLFAAVLLCFAYLFTVMGLVLKYLKVGGASDLIFIVGISAGVLDYGLLLLLGIRLEKKDFEKVNDFLGPINLIFLYFVLACLFIFLLL